MTDNGRVAGAALVGAVIGGVAGYVFLTERGRALRRQLEPALDDMMRELNDFRGAVMKASSMASDGWRLLNDAVREGVRENRVHDVPFTRTSQSHPF